jgi:1,4-dihydroxy-2-naphthoate octaprenyltransferase
MSLAPALAADSLVAPPADARSFASGLRRLADPKISLASIASMFLAACAAGADGAISWGWLAATVGGILAVEIAKNASGEIFDFDSGADLAVAPEDRSPFSGGKRVLVDGLLVRSETAAIAAFFYSLAAVVGVSIAGLREPRVLWLGVAGMAAAFFYQSPPVKLSYRGLGEAAVAICYGPLLCAGTYLVQRGSVPFRVVALSIPLGALIAAFLWINEFPDLRADRQSGKRTLVVRLGRRRASIAFAAIVFTAFALLLLEPLAGWPRSVWLGTVGLLPGVPAVRTLLRLPARTADIVPAQRQTLLAFLLLAAGSGIGLLAGRSGLF